MGPAEWAECGNGVAAADDEVELEVVRSVLSDSFALLCCKLALVYLLLVVAVAVVTVPPFSTAGRSLPSVWSVVMVAADAAAAAWWWVVPPIPERPESFPDEALLLLGGSGDSGCPPMVVVVVLALLFDFESIGWDWCREDGGGG